MSGPGEKKQYEKFLENKEQMIQVAKDFYRMIKEANEQANKDNKNYVFPYSEESFTQNINNQERINNFIKANAIMQRIVDYYNLCAKYKKEELADYKIPDKDGELKPISIDKGMARHYMFFLDTSGTEEATKKNIDFIKTISTKEGAGNAFNDRIKELMELDLSKTNFKSNDDMFNFYNDNFSVINFAFVNDTALSDGKYNLDKDVKEFLSTNKAYFNKLQDDITPVNYMATPLYLFAPEDLSSEEILNAYPAIENYCNDKDKIKAPGFLPKLPSSPSTMTASAIMSMNLYHKAFEAQRIGFNYLVDKGIIKKDFLFEYKTITTDPLSTCENVGKKIQEYNDLSKEEKENKTLDKYIEDSLVLKHIEKIKDEDRNRALENKLKNENFVINNKQIIDECEHINEHMENASAGYRFRRSIRRNNAVMNYINNVYSNDMIIKDNKLSLDTKNALAYNAYSIIKDIHESRSKGWIIFHPYQYIKEGKALEFCENKMRTLGGLNLDTNGARNIVQSIYDGINTDNQIMQEFSKNEIKEIDISEMAKNRSEKALDYDPIEENINKKDNVINNDSKGKTNTEEVLDELDFGEPKQIVENKLKNLAEDTSEKQPNELSKEVEKNTNNQPKLDINKNNTTSKNPGIINIEIE